MKKITLTLGLLTIALICAASWNVHADGPGPKRIAFAFTKAVYDSKRPAIRNAIGDMWYAGTNTLTEAEKDWADQGWIDLRLISNTNKIVKVYLVSQAQVMENVDAATLAKWMGWFDNQPGADVLITYGMMDTVKQHWGLTNIFHYNDGL